jgi:hypothetical protein
MIIAVDFDGTLHDGDWPSIGAPKDHAVEVMKRLSWDGHYLIIWTCREGKAQSDMLDWLGEWRIPFDRINENVPGIEKQYGYDARKVNADVYIDDRNLGGLPGWPQIYDIISGKVKPLFVYKFLTNK